MKSGPFFVGIKAAVIKFIKEKGKYIKEKGKYLKEIPKENLLYPLAFFIGTLIYLELNSHFLSITRLTAG